jgi:hypothetical protein
MPFEENMIALLKQGAVDAEAHEAARQARYESEDNARKAARAHEDALRDEGAKVRDAKIAEMEAAIAARQQTPEAQLKSHSDEIAAMQKKIEELAASQHTPEQTPAPEPEQSHS